MEMHFDDFEFYREATLGWGLEFVQLDRGPFQGVLRQASGQKVSLTHFRLDRQFFQQGVIRARGRTFAIFLNRTTPMLWRNRDDVGSDTLVVFPPDGALDAMTHPGFDAVSISIDQDLLEHVATQNGLEQACEVIPHQAVNFQTDGAIIDRLRVGVRTLLATDADTIDATERSEIEANIALLVLRAIAIDLRPVAPPSARKRDLAFAVAMEAIRGTEFPPSVSLLSEMVGASERTLRYAFEERMGVSVKHFIDARRMMLVKDKLLSARPGKSPVQDIAALFGYWHTGRFAADYRRMFGELPSETLMRRSDSML